MLKEKEEQIKETLSKNGYEYISPIGSGAFSNVFLCKSIKYNDQFAIKRVAKKKLSTVEYNALISLDHPNIIKLYIEFEDEESQYLVMEYCPNGTFRNLGNLDTDRFILYAKEILEALAYCHSQKIAHRDIKPENIFIDSYDRPKLADFGLAYQFDHHSTAEKCGTLMYCSPEIVKQQGEICPFKADIWALGITFFFMATGKFPFPTNSTDSLKHAILYGELDYKNIEINPQIHYLISKMTTINKNLRPTAAQLLKFPIFSPLNKGKLTRSSGALSSKKNIQTPFYSTGFSLIAQQQQIAGKRMPTLQYSSFAQGSSKGPISRAMSDFDQHEPPKSENFTANNPILSYRINSYYPNVNKMRCHYKPFFKPK